MTKLCQIISLILLAIIAVSSCGEAAAPVKLTPVQVPTIVTAADGASYLILNVSGTSILLSVGPSGVAQIPATVVNVNGPSPAPGPTPTPQPVPLSPRAILLRDAAAKATVDPLRSVTAQKLAEGYLTIASRDYTNLDTMAADAKAVADGAIAPGYVEAWKPFRTALANEWNNIIRQPTTGNTAYAALLRDAAAGLTTPITP